MTVKELKEKLNKCGDEARVYLEFHEDFTENCEELTEIDVDSVGDVIIPIYL